MRRAYLALLVLAVIGGGVAWTSWEEVLARGQAQAVLTNAGALHNEAIVVDGHVHVMEPVFHQSLDPWKVQPTGLFDYARAKQGGLDVVIHSLYIEDAYNNYNYGVKQALRLIETFYRVLEANQGKMELALTSADVRRIVASGKMAAILALEGMPDMEGDVDVVRAMYRLGVRMIQVTSHDTTNALADAWRDEHKWGGISDRGRAVIHEMNRLGIIVDISHASHEAMLQMIAISRAPVALNHVGLGSAQFSGTAVKPMSEGSPVGWLRVSDEVFKAAASKGGLMAPHQASVSSKRWADWLVANPQTILSGYNLRESGMFLSVGRRATLGLPATGIRPPDKDHGAYIAALDAEMHDNWTREPTGNRRGTSYGTPWRTLQAGLVETGVPLPTAADWVEHADSAIKLTGAEHVAIGLDLMSRPTLQDFDATQYGRLTDAMLKKGMSPETIKKVLGENWLRLLDQAKVPGLKPLVPTAPSR